jgi:hypothetical protein
MSSSAHPGGTSNSDWFELTNNGATAVDITGWSWDDDSQTPGVATFGAITMIGAGESVLITQETLGQEAAWRADWNVDSSVQVVNLGGSGIPGFSSGGDSIFIFDAADQLVTSVTFGPATQGFTFAWDRFGTSLGISVLGENGAYRASFNGAGGAGIDVGSVGFSAVPEPSALLLVGSIIGAGVLRRRRA